MNEELTPKTCPHCGTPQVDGVSCFIYDFNLESGMFVTPLRRISCYERQLATKDRELNAVRGELEGAKPFAAVGREMAKITTAVHGPDEWGAIPTLWQMCAMERNKYRTERAAARAERDELQALVGTIRSHLPIPVRNVTDIDCPAHSREIGGAIDQLRATNTELLEAMRDLEGAAQRYGLNGFTDKGQQIAYRFGWAHAIQKARAAIAKATT